MFCPPQRVIGLLKLTTNLTAYKLPFLEITMRYLIELYQRMNWQQHAAAVAVFAALFAGITYLIPEKCFEPEFEFQQNEKQCGTTTEKVMIEPEKEGSCQRSEFGIASWSNIETFPSRSTGWRGGGYNQPLWCTDVANAIIIDRGIGTQFKVETVSSSEEVKKSFPGQVNYKYHCSVKISWDPVYNSGIHPDCPKIPAIFEDRKIVATCKVKVGEIETECKK